MHALNYEDGGRGALARLKEAMERDLQNGDPREGGRRRRVSAGQIFFVKLHKIFAIFMGSKSTLWPVELESGFPIFLCGFGRLTCSVEFMTLLLSHKLVRLNLDA